MPNGLMDWHPLNDDEVTLGQVWGVLGVLMERSSVLPTLVTTDQCGLRQAKLREGVAKKAKAAKSQAGARRFSILLVVLSSLLSAVLAVGGVLALRMGG